MIRVYINPFDEQGSYTGFQEVTNDVESKSIGTLTQAIDFNEYDVGGVKFSDMSFTIRNTDGKYSDTDGLRSIFGYKRGDSKVRITWTVNPLSDMCGTLKCGYGPCGEDALVVFEGLINDEATSESVEKQNIKFKVLGYDSVIDRLPLPGGSPANGQDHETAIYNLLNQEPFNALVTVDSANIVCESNETIDDATAFEDDNAKSAVVKLLSGSNSVLTIRDNTVYVSSRVPTAEVKHIFRGQASEIGEDIAKISAAKNGQNRLFNYITWGETGYFSSDTTSVQKYLQKEKNLDLAYLTIESKIQNVLDDVRDSFAFPKKEFELTTFLSREVTGLELLDKVKVDYPTPLYAPIGEILPVYGLAHYGEGVYPLANFTITIDVDTDWKIITKKVDLKNKRLILKLREV